jgi:hypothetical protein
LQSIQRRSPGDKSIIKDYQEASGQLVNMDKSEIMFSKHRPSQIRPIIHQILPMQQVSHFSRYLGMPTQIGRSRTKVFDYIQDRIWKKLRG